jgi:hypothetical protein
MIVAGQDPDIPIDDREQVGFFELLPGEARHVDLEPDRLEPGSHLFGRSPDVLA